MSKELASLYNNIFSMVTLRALEYILAFILVPYLLRVLGPSNFGAVVFMQGLMGYLVLVVNYGFNLTAPRALARADEEDISFVFSVYMWARILLWISVTGWQIFLSTLAINLYTASDVVVLGLLTNHTIVGYYSGADKLINCVKLGVGAINDAVYPYISRLMKESQIKAFSLLRKQLFIYTGFGIIGGFLILFGSPVVVPFLLGSTYIPSILPLQIMAFVPLAVAVSNVLGYETMLPLGMEKIYSKILFCASILNVMIIVPFIYWKDASGVAAAMLVTEIFVTLMMGCVLWRKHILLRK